MRRERGGKDDRKENRRVEKEKIERKRKGNRGKFG